MPDRTAQGGPAPAKESARRRFLVNALASYGHRALAGFSAVLVTPYLFRTLGTGGFGTWAVMFTLTMVFGMLEEGFSLGTTKFVAAQRASGLRDKIETTLGASVLLMASLGLLAMAACALIALLASGLAAAGEQEAFRLGMLILGAGMLLRIPLVAYGSVLAGYQRYDLYNLARSVTIVSAALGSVGAVAAGGGVLGLAIAYAAALVAGGVTYPFLLKRLDPGLRMWPRRADRTARRQILGFSSFTMLADSMMFVGGRLDTVVIAGIRSAGAAAPFAAASTLQTGIQSLTLPVIDLMLPMASELQAKGLRETVIKRLVAATRVTLQVTIPVAVAMALFSQDIVALWLGDSAPSVTASIVAVMALNALMLCGTPAHKVLMGVGGARIAAVQTTIEGLSNLIISVILVSTYGAIGAAIGTLTASFVIGPANFPLACRATGCPVPRLLRDGLGRAVVSSLPSLAAMLPVWLLLPPGAGRLMLGLVAGIGVAALVAVLQVGPKRIVSEVRAGLQTPPEVESPDSQLATGGPV